MVCHSAHTSNDTSLTDASAHTFGTSPVVFADSIVHSL